MDIRHIMDPQTRRGLSHVFVLPGFPAAPKDPGPSNEKCRCGRTARSY